MLVFSRMFATRAIHLDVCDAIAGDSFINAFLCVYCSNDNSTCEIWRDNGSNLKADSSELAKSLKTIDWKGVVDKLSPRGVEWKHISPFAPKKVGLENEWWVSQKI